MGTSTYDDEATGPTPAQLIDSACGPPRRHALASQLDRAQVSARLFGERLRPVKIGRYTLLELEGSGGMGEIYAAYDEELDRKVALKLVRSDLFWMAQAEERLLREAKTLAQLSHPNVVQIYEAGRFEGRVFIAMEFIRGETLRRWLELHGKIGNRVRLREVLRQFVAAGRGLEAAHAAGLVHRDFKPDNVLIGDDARARVVDFGLARAMTQTAPVGDGRETPAAGADVDQISMGETLDAPGGRPLAAARALTTRGRILGTPPYMAPEQMRGEDADHRSDQFSFCVALYEALHGKPPFAGKHLGELRKAVESGALCEPPRGSDVPVPVRKALLRGMAADPAARFADMGALLAALEAWPHRRRRRLAAAVATAAVAVAGALIYGFTGGVEPGPCARVGATVTESWAPARRAAIRDAFSRAGVSYAGASLAALEPRIDRYAARLEGELVATCEATHEHEVVSSELMERRSLCLDSRRRRLDALLTQLEHADAAVIARAPLAVAELPDLDTCHHVETLRYGMQAPAPEIEEEVGQIRDILAEARTRDILGQGEAALRMARGQLARAEALGYGPLHAEALLQTGRVLVHNGTTQVAEGEDMLHRAALLAESERHDELVAEAWNHLVFSAARGHSTTERARPQHDRAVAAIKRIGEPPRYRADALRNLSRLYVNDGRVAEAEEHLRQALAVLESDPEMPPLARAVYLHDLANLVRERGGGVEADEIYERALRLHVAELGDTHPYVADIRFDMAMLHITRGASDEARDLLQDILRVHGEALGEHHPLVGRTYLAIADLDRQRGALERASAHAQTGLGILERAHGKDHIQLAGAHTRLGAIAYRRGAYDEALSAYETALTLEVKHLGHAHLSVGFSQANIAEALVALGRHPEAVATIEQAERILAPHMKMKTIPEIEPFVASVRGRALAGMGQVEAAIPALERAVQQFRALSGDSMAVERADACWALVQALSVAQRDPGPRSRALAQCALEVYDEQGPETRTPRDAVRRWLDGTPEP